MDSIKIPITKGLFATIDAEDFDLISQFTWHASKANKGKEYYASAHDHRTYPIKRTEVRMHRLIMGVTDPKVFVDHIDHDTLNNRKSNLRICTAKQNLRNSRKKPNGTSKYKGVSRCVTPKGFMFFQAKINIPGAKTKHLGSFQDEKLAALAYNQAADKYYGEFAHLNVVE